MQCPVVIECCVRVWLQCGWIFDYIIVPLPVRRTVAVIQDCSILLCVIVLVAASENPSAGPSIWYCAFLLRLTAAQTIEFQSVNSICLPKIKSIACGPNFFDTIQYVFVVLDYKHEQKLTTAKHTDIHFSFVHFLLFCSFDWTIQYWIHLTIRLYIFHAKFPIIFGKSKILLPFAVRLS